MVLLILVLTSLCVLATMSALALERREDVGLMKALGGSISRIVGLFLSEMGVLAATGGLIGCIVGLALSRWMGQRVFSASITPRWEVVPADRRLDGIGSHGWRTAVAPARQSEARGHPARRMMTPAHSLNIVIPSDRRESRDLHLLWSYAFASRCHPERPEGVKGALFGVSSHSPLATRRCFFVFSSHSPRHTRHRL